MSHIAKSTAISKPVLVLGLAALPLLALTPAAHANLLNNSGFEDIPGSITDATLAADPDYELPTYPITVDASDPTFQSIQGIWFGVTGGNGFATPAGTGNESSRATANRKATRYFQILPLNTVAAGEDLLLDWQYVVGTGHNDLNSGAGAAVSFLVEVVGLNQADIGEAATTFNSNWVFGGEAANSAILATSTVSIDAGAADGAWHDAPQTLIEINDNWDYIGLSVKRVLGVTNRQDAQTDNISLVKAAAVPEPASLALLGLGALALLNRRRP